MIQPTGATSNGAAFEQPASFVFDAESDAELNKIIARYPAGRQASAVIPALYIVQKQMQRQTGSAWVPVKGMDAVGARLGMAPIRVYEVATFYFMFNMKPIGSIICRSAPRRRAGCAGLTRSPPPAGRKPGFRAGAKPVPTACSR